MYWVESVSISEMISHGIPDFISH